MKTVNKTHRILGVAFLVQFITSFAGGVFLKPMWLVESDIGATMLKIAQSPWLMRMGIFLDMLTALGVIFLGVVLYLTLRRQHETIALTAMAFYVLEGTLLAASKLNAFSLLRLSQAYGTGQSPNLLLMGQIAYEAMEFVGGTLHMLAFCLGGMLFYFLFYNSGIVPHWLSLWGLITTLPMLVGTITQIFGSSIPFGFYVPYVPFELAIGLWILIKGIPKSSG